MKRTSWLLALAASLVLCGQANAQFDDFGGFGDFGGGGGFYGGDFGPGAGDYFAPGDIFGGPGALGSGGGLLGNPTTSLLGGGNPLTSILGGSTGTGLIGNLLGSGPAGTSLVIGDEVLGRKMLLDERRLVGRRDDPVRKLDRADA